MIAYLRGFLLGIEEDRALIDVQGIGYEVMMPPRLMQKLPPAGQEAEIYTYLHVRDDCLQLYGFLDPEDRVLFSLLLKTPGIGPRVALAILDTFNRADFSQMIAKGEPEGLQRVPGIGKKSAQRLLLEFRDKLPVYVTDEREATPAPLFDEVFQGLLALGYSRQESEEILRKIKKRKPTVVSAGEILREALKDLGKGKKE